MFRPYACLHTLNAYLSLCFAIMSAVSITDIPFTASITVICILLVVPLRLTLPRELFPVLLLLLLQKAPQNHFQIAKPALKGYCCCYNSNNNNYCRCCYSYYYYDYDYYHYYHYYYYYYYYYYSWCYSYYWLLRIRYQIKPRTQSLSRSRQQTAAEALTEFLGPSISHLS